MNLNQDNRFEFTIPKQSKLYKVTKKSWFKNMPTKKAGIYCLYNNCKEIVYIGRSINCMRQRLSWHFWGNSHTNDLHSGVKPHLCKLYPGLIKYFSFCEINNIDMIPVIEQFIIGIKNPFYNIEKPHYLNCEKNSEEIKKIYTSL